jgi:toxin ParE1/3/4
VAHELVFRAGARRDLQSLYSYVANRAGPAVADGYIQRLGTSIRRLTVFPLGGTPREDLGPGIRTLAFERRTVVAYRVAENAVEIVAIAHAGRVLPAQFSER